MQAQAVVPGSKRPRGNRMARREARAFYLFVSPWLIGFLVFSLGPIIAAGYFSFTDLQVLNVNNGLPNLVGLHNYQVLFRDRTFWLALRATAIFTLGGLTINTVVGILLAQLLNQRIPGLRLFRTIYYMPIVIAGVAAAYIWPFTLRTSAGIINDILSVVPVQAPHWLANV